MRNQIEGALQLTNSRVAKTNMSGSELLIESLQDQTTSRLNGSARKLVSIVIPCYNGARYLPDAIESCLRQTYRNLEIIIVDDASPDDCAAIGDRYAQQDSRVRVLRRPQNGGVSRAFNTGYEAARGEYFTRLAQDDIFRIDAIEAMVHRLECDPKAGLTYCDGQRMTADGVLLDARLLPQPTQALAFRNLVCICVMWRRAVWQKVGGFNPEVDCSEDFEYWLRVAQLFPLSKCPGGPYIYGRTHQEQGSIRLASRQEASSTRVVRHFFPATSLRKCLLRWRALSYIAYSAGATYSSAGMQWRGLHRVIKSLLLWPFPFPPYEVDYQTGRSTIRPLIRLKSLVVILLRILRLRRDIRKMPTG